MDVILSTIKRKFALVYFNAILIFFRSTQKHISHIRHVLTLFRNAVVILMLKICEFFTETIAYLGHIIRLRHLQMASHITNDISGWQAPANLTKLWSFLRFCNVFRQFIPNFSRIAASLSAELRKERPKTFGPLFDEMFQSMNFLKGALISSPVLTFSN